MRLTVEIVAEQLVDLARVFKAPNGDARETARIYHAAVRDVPPEAFIRACRDYIRRDERFFPKPGALRRLALEAAREMPGTRVLTLAGQYREWLQNGMQDPETGKFVPCPVCESVVERPHNGRFVIYHEHQRHFETGIAYAGPRTGPVTAKGAMKPAIRPA